ncbi:stage III sporulation protein AE [Vallitalea guaymasensis]|uniref:Stage III sporulation protein AE n=1 Tax=Vallitalea guaymasensis TaxID=1185412 RepID=A0A8J8MDS9_9FIRM|nr:stage III sporulation protein AE [Vallitalea guaymasensis]QUH31047.1 stage III sporulation protein AE [Vallitalea guaymasensis]
MRRIRWLLIIVIALKLSSISVFASSELDSILAEQEKVIEYDDIQSAVDEILSNEEGLKIDFRETLNKVISGDLDLNFNDMFGLVLDNIFIEVKGNIKLIIELIAIALIAAVFTNFTTAFNNKYVGEVGYFVVFLLMSTIILKSYNILNTIALQVISNLQTFIKTLIPSLFAATALSGNYTSTFLYSQIMLIIIGVVENIILKYVVPFVYIIIVLEIINSITEESILSKMVELFKNIVNWGIKVLVIVFAAVLTMQSFTTPVIDGIANKSVKVAVSAIPFVGTTLSGVADTVLGCAVLIKNGIGIVALIIIIVICLIPIIKILVVTLLYKFASAIIQPISDKRIVNCLSNVGDICFILLGIVIITAFLFIITITIILNATSITAYIR